MSNGTVSKTHLFDTLKVRMGYDPKEHHYTVSPPIYQTTAYELRDVENAKSLFSFQDTGYLYTRIGNPTVAILEERVRILDRTAAAIGVDSGMATTNYILLNLAEGDGRTLVSPSLYSGSADNSRKIYSKLATYFDQARNIEQPERLTEEITLDTKAIYIESISNPGAVLLDVDAIAKVTHEHGIPLVVDNTVVTPYLYGPIVHGAGIVVYSATKGLSGHGDLVAGLVLESGHFDLSSEKPPQFPEKYYTLRDRSGTPRSYLDVLPVSPFTSCIRLNYLNYFGAALFPFDTYLAIIGLETLSERLGKQSRTTHTLTKYLSSHETVEWVRYPTLKFGPYRALYERDFGRDANGILAFGFKGTQAQREAFLDAVKLFNYHVDIEDARSLIVNSPQTAHGELGPHEKLPADVPEDLTRISAGLEGPADLIADLKQASQKALAI